MGMYCNVYGKELKLKGLLGQAIVEAASTLHQGYKFAGVKLTRDGDQLYPSGGIVRLTRYEVMAVASIMRKHLLGGWANKANFFAVATGGSQPLSTPQDILHYVSDVEAFGCLNLWLVYTSEEELVWA